MKLDRSKLMMMQAKKKLTLKEIAKMSGVSYETIRKSYTKEIGPVQIGKIADALDVPVEEIIICNKSPETRTISQM
ncbi:helix-turn-helix transcriptional regulator [Anaerovorax odorimutans]|uniref:Helix-turn-helix transcriptional regulator n=1 Tax=Anaerovorax odorimutans TaxID=109327 RepID=A0ABT1RR73_9FIRM|nr:helix-turn-helix transcriptional regulator [Anaerovorax odorimutans]MCQ4637701.1 helix-turn-helix transcriptional regulator [Anaerovorax odorimutans]